MSVASIKVYHVKCDGPTCQGETIMPGVYAKPERALEDAIAAGWNSIGRHLYCPGCRALWADVIGVIRAPVGARDN